MKHVIHATDTFNINDTLSTLPVLDGQFYLSPVFSPFFIPPFISQVNDSSPKTVLSQLCELLAARPLQGLVYEEERPPPTAWGPLAPMLEFVSAQTGLPIVAVGGGAGLGRMPQVGEGRLGKSRGNLCYWDICRQLQRWLFQMLLFFFHLSHLVSEIRRIKCSETLDLSHKICSASGITLPSKSIQWTFSHFVP